MNNRCIWTLLLDETTDALHEDKRLILIVLNSLKIIHISSRRVLPISTVLIPDKI